MTNNREAYLAAIENEPENYDHRYAYADWLDEIGEHEEADRQRSYQASEFWLKEFARTHEEFGDLSAEELEWYEEEGLEPELFDCGFQRLLFFLERHVDGNFFLPFETPYSFTEYSENYGIILKWFPVCRRQKERTERHYRPFDVLAKGRTLEF